MSFIANLFLKKYLEKRKTVRAKQLTSIGQAKDIGLLCKITDEDSYKEINAVFTQIPRGNRTVWLMGYCDGKIVPFYCLQQLTADFFCNKDINWFGKPEKIQIEDYIKREFDLLLDFTHDDVAPVRMILSLSKAKCITGSNPMHKDLYDLYIDTPDDLSHKMLLNQVDLYTKKLTGENDEQ